MRTLLDSIFVILLAVFASIGASSDFDNVRIELLNGSSIRGTISSISTDGRVVGTGLPAGLTFDQVLEIKTERDPETYKGTATIHLIGGGVMAGTTPHASDETISFTNAWGPNSLKLELVEAIVWVESPRVAEAMQNRSKDNDLVLSLIHI